MKKIGVGKKKKKSASEASREVVWGGKRVAEPSWRHAFDAADPPSSNKLVIEISTLQHVSLLCRFCNKIFEFEMKP